VALTWAASQLPGLEQFPRYERLVPSVAPWFKVGASVVLYVRGDWRAPRRRPADCIPLELHANDDATLTAALDAQGRGCRSDLILSDTAQLFPAGCADSGSEHASYGSGDTLNLGLVLSTADAAGLVYAGVPVHVTPECSWTVVDQASCPSTPCRSCRLYLAPHGRSGQHTIASARPGERRITTAGADCSPCLEDAAAAQLVRLERILSRQAFLSLASPLESLHWFRAREACTAHVRELRKAAAERAN
jgi:hypothetical protein